MDIVGPLPISRGFSYMLTIVDRYTRWSEAIPIPDITAETVVRAFIEHWVARFGAPTIITTDRGQQFESVLFNSMLQFLGCSRHRTTAYHPAANGMVERFHRQLKSSLMANGDVRNWSEHLPLVLLGIRSSVKLEMECCPAELVYGTTLRLPGELICPNAERSDEAATNFVHRLREFMRRLTPTQPRVQFPPSFVDPHLKDCSYVFVRCDHVRKPLETPYEGPFQVLVRKDKTFTINRHGKQDVITIDRLKAAFIDMPHDPCKLKSAHSPSTSSPGNFPDPTVSCSVDIPSTQPDVRITRSGRQVLEPNRLLLYSNFYN
jgi:hypothetical protein